MKRINTDQRDRFVKKVCRALWTIKGKRLAILGISYKGGTDDVRKSPAIAIVRTLIQRGAEVTVYDPAANRRAKEELADCPGVRFAGTIYDAAEDADALLILSDWEEFAALDLDDLRDKLKQPIIIDGRNLYTRKQMLQAGFSYHSIGRVEVTTKPSFALRKFPKADAADTAA